MKIIKDDKKTDLMVLLVHTLDDLWTLAYCILPGALVTAWTHRKVKVTDTAVAKKSYRVTLHVEKIVYGDELLRISGIVTSEHDDIPKGSHQSLTIAIHDEINIVQPWLQYQRERIHALTKPSQKILLMVLDREEAHIASMTHEGYKVLFSLNGDVSKKGMPSQTKQAKGNSFYDELVKALNDYYTRFTPDAIIIGSPAFFKDELYEKLSSNVKSKVVLAICSSADVTAFSELLARDETKKALHMARSREEHDAVEILFVAIAKEKPVAYGYDTVSHAINEGNITQVLVTTNVLSRMRESVTTSLAFDTLLHNVEKVSASIMIISSETDAGKRLDGITGFAALLRY